MKESLKKTHGVWCMFLIVLKHKKCNKAEHRRPCLLIYVPDWFLREELIKIWHDDDGYSNDNWVIKWYDGYQKRKV